MQFLINGHQRRQIEHFLFGRCGPEIYHCNFVDGIGKLGVLSIHAGKGNVYVAHFVGTVDAIAKLHHVHAL